MKIRNVQYVQESPINVLTSPMDETTIADVMAAGASITQEQLERDLVRTRKEIDRLRQQELTLLGTLGFYFPGSPLLATSPAAASVPTSMDKPLEEFSIADAGEVVFRDLGNQWLSLSDLDNELKRRGKVCNKGSIELMLKAKPDKFEIAKRGKKNVYRLKV